MWSIGIKFASGESKPKNQQFCTQKKRASIASSQYFFFGKILNFASNDNDGTVLATVNIFKHTRSFFYFVFMSH